jgi:hypothetical protein
MHKDCIQAASQEAAVAGWLVFERSHLSAPVLQSFVGVLISCLSCSLCMWLSCLLRVVIICVLLLQDQDVLLSWSAVFKGNLLGDPSLAAAADDMLTSDSVLLDAAAP